MNQCQNLADTQLKRSVGKGEHDKTQRKTNSGRIVAAVIKQEEDNKVFGFQTDVSLISRHESQWQQDQSQSNSLGRKFYNNFLWKKVMTDVSYV